MVENIKILIADDSELMRLLMKRFFAKWLSSPIIVERGNLPDTLEILRQESFNFVLLDINMSKGDSSPNTVKEILGIQPDIKVCMFSGNDKSALEQSYLDAGAIGFIQKDESMSSAAETVIKKVFY